jgi:hypothetical protein
VIARDRVAVLYSQGAAGPREIVNAGSCVGCELVLVLDETDPDSIAAAPLLTDVECFRHSAAEPSILTAELVRRRVEGVVTFSERLVDMTARVSAVLGVPGHEPDVARTLTNKLAQRQALNDAGVSVTRFASLGPGTWRDALDSVGLPAVIKPAVSSGSRGVVRAQIADDVRASAERGRWDDELLIEEFLGVGRHPASDALGDYVSVESLSIDGNICHFFICDKLPIDEWFRETGVVGPTHLAEALRRDIERLVTDALGALRVRDGIFHTEVKLSSSGPRVIEVNGRLGGSVQRVLDLLRLGQPVAYALWVALGQRPPCGDFDPSERKVAARVFVLPPKDAATVVAMPPMRALRAIPAVVSVTQHAAPGSRLRFEDGSQARVLTVELVAPDLPDLLDGIDAVRAVAGQLTEYAS